MYFKKNERRIVLMADDDPDDRFFVKEACQEIGKCIELRCLEDGEELMQYLRRSENCGCLSLDSKPKFILLDINMPRKNGIQALSEIKTDPNLKTIPVVIWTTSNDAAVEAQCRKNGADDFVSKPSAYNDFVNGLQTLIVRYCFRSNSRVHQM